MNAKNAKGRKRSVSLEPLESRQLLSTTITNWASFPKLIGQDKEVANYPTINGAGQNVAIIDHGIDTTHPYLDGGAGVGANNLVIYAYDFATNTSLPTDVMDYDGHGTGVSGIIGEDPITYNGVQDQGIATGSKQILLKTGDAGDPNAEQHIKDALDWVIANHTQYHISVVNLTDFVGSGNQEPIYASELQTLNNLGIFISSPVGNGGTGVPIGYPAADPYVYGVGAISDDNTFFAPTQTGSALDILAPGNSVLMTYDDYSKPAGQRQVITPYATGTSFATAHVNALALLIKQVNPNFTPAQIMQIMQDSGVSVTDPSSGIAYKRIDINAAVGLAIQRSSVSNPGTDGTPYGGTALNIASTGTTTIEAENFNVGADGVAYHDTDSGNVFGTNYRQGTNVDVFDTNLASNGHLVGWTKAGEYLKYTVNVSAPGSYTLGVNAASVGLGGTFHVEVDGVNVTGTLAAPNTNSWTTFTTVNGGTINLTAGTHVIKLAFDTSQQGNGYMANFDSLALTATGTTPLPSPGQVSSPTPADGATLGASPSVLSWAAASNAQSYNVYLDGAFAGSVTTPQYTVASALAAGLHSWQVIAVNTTGTAVGPTWSFTVPAPTPNDGTPFGGSPVTVAASGATTIEAENFNVGADGIAYHDTDSGNVFGTNYRPGTNVDVFDTGLASNGHLVGWTKAGEYLKYTVNVTTAGSYTLGVKTASVGLGGLFHVEVDGVNVSGTMAAPDTGSWTTFTTVSGGTINLTAGQHVVRLVMDSAQQGNGYMANFDSLTLTGSGTPVDTAPTASLAAVATVTSGTTTDLAVTYTDADGTPVKASTLVAGNVLVTGPNGYSQVASLVSVNTPGDGSPRTATYRITAPGGTWASTANGTYTVSLQANQVSDTAGNFITAQTLGTFTVNVAAPSNNDGTPYGGTALSIATTGTTTIEAENFNVGADGIAYHDTDSGNVFGTNYRPGTNVDVFDTGLASNGHLVGWTKAGEYLKYTVNVTTAGSYTLGVKTASVGLGGLFHVEVDGVNVSGTMAAPDTGSWTTWTTVSGGTINLTAGQHVVRLVMDSAQQGNGYMANFDSLALTATSTTLPAPGIVSGPTPANGATLTSAPTVLQWTAASNAQSYDVYVDGTFAANVTNTQWTVNRTLGSGSHTWQVTAKNTTANTVGPLWNFTISPSSPPPVVNTNITKLTGNQVESSTAVNPTNPNNIVSVSATDVNNGNQVIVSRSTDGGATWSVSAITSSQDGINSSTPRNDPHVAFDAFGNLYVTYLSATSGSALVAVVARSSDGGASFASVVIAATSTHLDFPVIATGVDPTNSARQAIYIVYTDYATNRIEMTQSISRGLGQWAAFGSPIAVNQRFGTVASVAVGASGQVAVAWQDTDSGVGPSNVYMDVSTSPAFNGFGPDQLVAAVKVGGLLPIPAEPNRTVYASPSVAFDTSNSATKGRLYLSYVDSPAVGSYDTNIELRYTDNLGGSWSAPKQINDDATQRSQFLPALAVDPLNGNVALTWYDARNSPSNNTAQVFAAVSTDHGLTFSANAQISNGASDASKAQYNSAQVGVLDLGDYIGLAFASGKLVATWADNSNSTGDNPNGATDVDIYASILSVPLA